MKKVKEFFKKYTSEILAVGGIIAATAITIGVVNNQLKTINEIEKFQKEAEEADPNMGYDLWLMATGENSKEMFDNIQKIVEDNGKTIMIEEL